MWERLGRLLSVKSVVTLVLTGVFAYLSVTGSICGVRLDSIGDGTMRRMRVLDKLVDDLAKGRSLERILSPFGYSV